MDKTCVCCEFARLIYNKEQRDKYVGCTKHNGNDEELIESINNANYVTEENYIYSGWIYPKLPPGVNRDDYDSIGAGIIANLCLITPYNSYCDLFRKRGY